MFGSVSESTSWKWRTARTPHVKHGPQRLEPPDLPASESGARNPSTEFNQCVFIRYYTMREGLFPKVIRAGAGPHDLGPGENRGDTFHELAVRYGAEPTSVDENTGGQWNTATNGTSSELDVVIRNVPYVRFFVCSSMYVLMFTSRMRTVTAGMPLPTTCSR
jgi:hypothetical protein